MCQRSVEQALGRLVTDEQFRSEFQHAPERAAIAAGLDLTAHELAALAAVSPRVLANFGARLDDRICRPRVPGSTGIEEIDS